ncbi:hypothetical protein BJY04DRAFT_230616 [Aspergillus karnatakaensis]|uniref:uncharacterized protein n=1 Tax=Aspergillus karnatakaensis TaxID=1810916 RepID=UPI003CCD0AD6
MSNHPIPSAPPYWGPANYTQQWPPQQSAPGSVSQTPHYPPDPSSNPQFYNFENFYANSNLPGLGGACATGSFPPPPFGFPGGFPPAAIPPPFAPLPNMGYPLVPPLPPAPSHLPPHIQPMPNDLSHPTHSNAPDRRPSTTTGSKQDLDREEGELTDFDDPETQEKQAHFSPSAARAPGATPGSSARNTAARMGQSQSMALEAPGSTSVNSHKLAAAKRRESLYSDLEEGEASPERRASTGDSGSPYNPPMPNDEPAFVQKSLPQPPPIDSSTDTANTPLLTPSESEAALSPAKLRMDAKGALLSLAPHSIRYSELVGEGISPIILKQLYAEVGIKVPTDVDSRTETSDNADSMTSLSTASGQASQLAQRSESRNNAMHKPASVDTSANTNQPTQANTAKPMERKESSPAPTTPQTDNSQVATTPQNLPSTVEKSVTSSPPRDLSSSEKELRVKEKKKAQTELARQRIEQLKKQGLMRSSAKAPPDGQLLDKERAATHESMQGPTSTIVQHPLPERPPIPESVSLEQIPGLFMSDQVTEQMDSSPNTSDQNQITESTTPSRASQRKRPRASDFDEPIPIPKRPFSNGMMNASSERLIIDISDDEFYGDDEDIDMYTELTSTDPSKDFGTTNAELPARTYPAPIESLPHRPATSQSGGMSIGSTPNNLKNGEQEDLRRRDLEIQAMRRKIAELELRKKAKLASRTQSPRTAELSPPQLPNIAISTLPLIADKMENNVLPMDVDVLRVLKAKLLRMQEIEAGVPSLDAKILKSETKLSDTRREEAKLSLELTKGKEGRRQLLEELSTLKSELNGLSLDQVNATLINLEAQKELPIEAVQGMLRRLSIPGLQHTNTPTYHDYAVAPSSQDASVEAEVPGPVPQVQENASSPHSLLPAAVPHSSSAEHLSNSVGDTSTLQAPINESSDTSMSEDSSSSMDESSDDSSSSSGSLNDEMLDVQDVNANLDAQPDAFAEPTASAPSAPNELAENEPQFEYQPSNVPPLADVGTNDRADFAAERENIVSRESSVSEAYEPPEPEESASASDSSYSPAPSPDLPSPTDMDISGSSEDHSPEAGEPLTEKVQDLDFQQPRQPPQIGLLDVRQTSGPQDSQRKFSPYTSPLKMFKAYRFHPDYNTNVPGGYRSLTYSHNIDPLKYLCPFEVSGGVCNDRSCEFQHFRDMALSGASISDQ